VCADNKVMVNIGVFIFLCSLLPILAVVCDRVLLKAGIQDLRDEKAKAEKEEELKKGV